MERFRFLEHTADIKFRAFGKNVEEAFENSALAVFSAMYEGKVKKKKKIRIKINGKDFENLLYNFLEEFLFLFETKGFLSSQIDNLKINKKTGGFELYCEAWGDNAENYELERHIKAVTYNEMFVKKQESKWIAQVVLDV